MSSVAIPTRSLPPVLTHRRSVADYWGRVCVIVTILCWTVSPLVGVRLTLMTLTLFSLAMAAAGLFQPRIGMLGISMAVNLDALSRSHLATGGLFRFNSLNYWLIFSALCFLPLIFRREDVHTLLLVTLIALLALGLLVSPVPEHGAQHLLGLVSVLGIVVYLSRCALDPGIWLWMGIVNGTLSAIGGLPLYLLDTDRGNANVWANFPLTGLMSICVASLFASERGNVRLLLAGLAGTNYAWIFLSGSRGALALATICIAFLFLTTHGLRKRWLFAAVGLCLMIGLAVSFDDLSRATLGRVSKAFDPAYSAAESTSGRSVLLAAGLDTFRSNPLGVGTGAYVIETAAVAAQTFSAGRAMQAHSAWVKTLTENGIPGVVLLIAYVFSFAAIGIRRGGRAKALGFLTTAVLIVAFTWTEFANKGLWLLVSATTVLINPVRIYR